MAHITILPNEPIARINPHLYGHFSEHLGACIYDGICVPENLRTRVPNVDGLRGDVIDALKKICPPILRWPGGCFADDYHWRDGIGPREKRPRTVNLWWGDSIETNQFGTHEFLQFCKLIGAQPYLAGNVGSGWPRELRDWVEYCNFDADSTLALERATNGAAAPFRVKYWGVGNENWGCGGHFYPEDYAAEYKRFATYLHDFPGAPLFLIACGPDGNNLDWTRRFFSKLGGFKGIHGFAAHYYCGAAGTATEYSTEEWYELLYKATAMETLIRQQRTLLDSFDPQRQIGLIVDEWGTWHPPTPGKNPKHLWQQNTLRDALVAAITLDIFNRNADKLVMANLAQTINVLQALILTENEKMLLTPTYHVFDMYQSHQGAQSVRTVFEAPDQNFSVKQENRRLPGLMGSASLQEKSLTLSVVNPSPDTMIETAIAVTDTRFSSAALTQLAHSDIHAHNTFDQPYEVTPQVSIVQCGKGECTVVFPPASVNVLRITL